jgi:glycosyltransferase involved in cell wall biosynthesis
MNVTIAIPTYNRADTLRKALLGYAVQLGDHRMIQLVVVDDGSTDHTGAVVEECRRSVPMELCYLHQENAGLSSARNHAIREAKGDLLLFVDDDIVPASCMVASHVAWHDQHPAPEVGVLGHVAWSPELRPTPFMKWSGLYGPQFNYGYFKRGAEVHFQHAYFCNTSLKTRFVRQHRGFDEGLRTYGYEDIELSYRLCQSGYRLLYNPSAVGYHYKYETFADTVRRVHKLYESWPAFAGTEAAAQLVELSVTKGTRQKIRILRKVLSPLKGCILPLLTPLCDTHIPLPGWLYCRIFYHHVRPFANFACCASTGRKATQQV